MQRAVASGWSLRGWIRAVGGTVKLDFTNAVITQPTLQIQAYVRGGGLVLVTKPGIEVDADGITAHGGAGEELGGGQLSVEGVAGDEFGVGSGPPGSPTPTSAPWPPTMPRGGVSAVAFGTTASGQLLLATASKNRKVRLWDPIRKLNVATLGSRCNTPAIAIAAPLPAIGDDEGLSVVEPLIDGWPRQQKP